MTQSDSKWMQKAQSYNTNTQIIQPETTTRTINEITGITDYHKRL